MKIELYNFVVIVYNINLYSTGQLKMNSHTVLLTLSIFSHCEWWKNLMIDLIRDSDSRTKELNQIETSPNPDNQISPELRMYNLTLKL